MKKTSKGYVIDYIAKTITVTRVFAKAAGMIGSVEYNEMLTLRKDHSDFSFRYKEITRNNSKKTYKGLTIEEMKRFIKKVDSEKGSNEGSDLFNRVLKVADCRQNKYTTVKKWFLDNYQKTYDKELEDMKIKDEDAAAAAGGNIEAAAADENVAA